MSDLNLLSAQVWAEAFSQAFREGATIDAAAERADSVSSEFMDRFGADISIDVVGPRVANECEREESPLTARERGGIWSKNFPDPTPEMLGNPAFNAIWNAIKTWDISVPDAYPGYCGATGNHARVIFEAVTKHPEARGWVVWPAPSRSMGGDDGKIQVEEITLDKMSRHLRDVMLGVGAKDPIELEQAIKQTTRLYVDDADELMRDVNKRMNALSETLTDLLSRPGDSRVSNLVLDVAGLKEQVKFLSQQIVLGRASGSGLPLTESEKQFSEMLENEAKGAIELDAATRAMHEINVNLGRLWNHMRAAQQNRG